jgi:capsular polysaccharide biosynthesis protein
MILTTRKVRLDSAEDYLLATDQESINHFHWFTEALPRLWLVKDRAAGFVLMLADTPYMRSIAAESLRLAGLRFKEIFWMQSGEFYTVPRLHHISKISRTGQMNDAIMTELNRAFVSEKPPGDRKLYVSRAAAKFRKVLNEEELQERLKSFGFEIIQTEDLSLAEQIATFSECHTLVGIHGAGLTNCLFMRAGGIVVELRKREPNYGYWHLAESVGHEYLYYHGMPDSELSLIGRGCNLIIPVDDFEEKILKII